jgi:hypothetical protein
VGEENKALANEVKQEQVTYGTRKLHSLTTKRLVEAFRADLVAQDNEGSFLDPGCIPTIREAVDHWREQRALEVKPSIPRSYRRIAKLITGPLLERTPKECYDFDMTGNKPHMTTRLLKLLGDTPANEITTANILKWHNARSSGWSLLRQSAPVDPEVGASA